MENTILKIDKVSKRFPGVQALKDVEFDLKEGEVHALVGENGAGKSTLMKIILGMYSPSEGQMFLNGNKYSPKNPNDALNGGISMIHQEISLAPTLSVSDNVWLGNEHKFGKFFNGARAKKKATQEILKALGLEIEADTEISKLSISQMQMVEIARAVSRDSKIIIMDEPSSSLTEAEVDKLFKIIKGLKAAGKSIIYISHKLDEVFTICDTVTVFRDGQYVARKPTNDLTKKQLVSLMVGRDMSDMYPKINTETGDVILNVENLSCAGDRIKEINFSLRKGEILGFCGLVGAGRTEVVQAIFGLDQSKKGEVFINGKKVLIKSTKDAINNKIGLVTEDRRGNGLVTEMSVMNNMTLAYLKMISKAGFISRTRERAVCAEQVKSLAIKRPSDDSTISLLSGGNQQKVIISKWLLTNPDILILDEPTRGIDVGAKAEIYKLIGSLAAQGKAIIMVSSELPELFGVCDRLIVMHQGKINGEFTRKDFNQEKVMQCAFGLVV